MFTTVAGSPLHPDWLTRTFGRLVRESGLPPVRLHDLRHGAATLAHAAGADLKTVQEQLGHTSIVLTADTYTSVLLDLHFKIAEATPASSWPPPPATPADDTEPQPPRRHPQRRNPRAIPPPTGAGPRAAHI